MHEGGIAGLLRQSLNCLMGLKSENGEKIGRRFRVFRFPSFIFQKSRLEAYIAPLIVDEIVLHKLKYWCNELAYKNNCCQRP